MEGRVQLYWKQRKSTYFRLSQHVLWLLDMIGVGRRQSISGRSSAVLLEVDVKFLYGLVKVI